MLAIRVVEHLLVEPAVVNQRRRHVPVRNYHADVRALRTHDCVHVFSGVGRIESEEPVTRLAHDRFATKVVKSQNQICICLLTHFPVLLLIGR